MVTIAHPEFTMHSIDQFSPDDHLFIYTNLSHWNKNFIQGIRS